MAFTYKYERPALTADCVIFGRGSCEPQVLLVQRDRAPYAGCWALPGGFVDAGEELADAARRELREETGVVVERVEQVGTFGGVGRDPRGRVISVAYYGEADAAATQPAAADDARDASWFPLSALPPLAFDHAEILRSAQRCLDRDQAEGRASCAL